jgi:hypothetical protein
MWSWRRKVAISAVLGRPLAADGAIFCEVATQSASIAARPYAGRDTGPQAFGCDPNPDSRREDEAKSRLDSKRATLIEAGPASGFKNGSVSIPRACQVLLAERQLAGAHSGIMVYVETPRVRGNRAAMDFRNERTSNGNRQEHGLSMVR